MTSQIEVLDNGDDRKEVWSLLHRLPPPVRVEFLAHACGMAKPGPHCRLPAPVPNGFARLLAEARRCDRADEMLTNSVYADLLQLFHTWGVDAAKAAVTLEAWGRGRRPSARPASSAGPGPSAPSRTAGTARSARPRGTPSG